MPSVRYFNQTAPFWDFVANLEDQGTSHPFFGNNRRGEASENEHEGPNPWAEGWAGFPWGPFAHRGRPGQHPHPPPPPHNEAPTSSPPAPEGESDPEAGPSDDAQRERGAHRHGRRDHHHRGHGPWRGHPGMGGRGGHFGRGHGRRGFHPYAMGPFGGLADMFQNQFFPGNNTGADENGNNENNEFTPEIDVFDAAEAFVVHVSLPGAKKEDVAVSWDAEKSELAITGVAHRPGDEELLKTLALNERKVGAFERKVRLGSRANPAQVEADHITARMEDGVLRVEVPKLDAGYVEVKKVDIE